MGNSNKNPFSKAAAYQWYESEQVSGCFLSHSYEYSISSGFQMNGKGSNSRESASSSDNQKLPTKFKLILEKYPVWSFYVNEERTILYECLEGNDDRKEINQDHVFDLVKEGKGDLLGEFHVLAKIVQLVTDHQFGLLLSNPHNSTIVLFKQQGISSTSQQPKQQVEQIASFNKQDDRKLGASSFNVHYGERTMYESEVFCHDLDRVYLNFVLRKVEEIIKDLENKATKTN